MMLTPASTNGLSEPDQVKGLVLPASGVAPSLPKDAPPISVIVVETAEELIRHREAWINLARNALEPNIFYEPALLLPAIRAFGQQSRLLFVLLFSPDPKKPHGPPLLSGLFPLQRRSGLRGTFLGRLGLWKHLYCFLCTPLLRAEVAASCLTAFFRWAASDARGGAMVDFPFLCGDGPFQRLLIDQCNEHGNLTFVKESWHRALYQTPADLDGYLRGLLTSKRRTELKRQEKKLAQLGPLEYRTLDSERDLEKWLDDFLRLEASGWKGKQHDAMKQDSSHREFFRNAATVCFEQRRLMMHGLFLGGQPIALKCNFLSIPGSFAFKIAFDESYARYSPGVQLEIANMKLLGERTEVAWMDSCADPDNGMINRIWRERRIMQSVLASTGRWGGDLLLSLLPLCKWIKRKFVRRRPLATPSSSTQLLENKEQ